MKKVAKLVYVSLLTRVVVDADANEEQICETAKAQLVEKIMNDIGDNIESIEEDKECPYGVFTTDGDDCYEYEGENFVVDEDDHSEIVLGELAFNNLSGVIMKVDAEDLKNANDNWFKVKPAKQKKDGRYNRGKAERR